MKPCQKQIRVGGTYMWPRGDSVPGAVTGPNEVWVRETLNMVCEILHAGSADPENFENQDAHRRIRLARSAVHLATFLLGDYPDVLVEKSIECLKRAIERSGFQAKPEGS